MMIALCSWYVRGDTLAGVQRVSCLVNTVRNCLRRAAVGGGWWCQVVCGHSIACTTANKGAHAGQILQRVLAVVGGRGGGKSGFAQGQLPPAVPDAGSGGEDDTLCTSSALTAALLNAGVLATP